MMRAWFTLSLLLVPSVKAAPLVQQLDPPRSKITFVSESEAIPAEGSLTHFSGHVTLDTTRGTLEAVSITSEVSNPSLNSTDVQIQFMLQALLQYLPAQNATFQSNTIRIVDARHIEAEGVLQYGRKRYPITFPATLSAIGPKFTRVQGTIHGATQLSEIPFPLRGSLTFDLTFKT